MAFGEEKISSLSGRKLLVKKDNLIVYQSKYGDAALELNGAARNMHDKQIVCRHLSWFVLQNNMKGYHDYLKSAHSIRLIDTLWRNTFDEERKLYNGSHYYFTNYHNLGMTLFNLTENLQEGETTNFLFNSSNHAMAIGIQRKDSNYVVKFYDPNTTNIHVRAVCLDRNSLKDLQINYFLSDADIQATWVDSPSLTLISYDEYRFKDKVARDGLDDFQFVHNLVNYNLADELSKFDNEQFAKLFTSNPGFTPDKIGNAISHNNQEVIKIFVRKVLGSNLTEEQKIEFFVPTDVSKTAPLWLMPAMTAFIYLNEVIKSNLSESAKIKLIQASYKGQSRFDRLLEAGYVDRMAVFMNAVLNTDSLSNIAKLELLFPTPLTANSGIVKAIQKVDLSTISLYLQKLLESKLPEEDKTRVIGSLFENTLNSGLTTEQQCKIFKSIDPTVVSAKAGSVILEKILGSTLAPKDKIGIIDYYKLATKPSEPDLMSGVDEKQTAETIDKKETKQNLPDETMPPTPKPPLKEEKVKLIAEIFKTRDDVEFLEKASRYREQLMQHRHSNHIFNQAANFFTMNKNDATASWREVGREYTRRFDKNLDDAIDIMTKPEGPKF